MWLGSVFLYFLGAFSIRPTSIKRGEGLLAGWLHVVGRELSWRGRRWWYEDEPVTRLMSNSSSARTAEDCDWIAIDINPHWHDK